MRARVPTSARMRNRRWLFLATAAPQLKASARPHVSLSQPARHLARRIACPRRQQQCCAPGPPFGHRRVSRLATHLSNSAQRARALHLGPACVGFWIGCACTWPAGSSATHGKRQLPPTGFCSASRPVTICAGHRPKRWVATKAAGEGVWAAQRARTWLWGSRHEGSEHSQADGCSHAKPTPQGPPAPGLSSEVQPRRTEACVAAAGGWLPIRRAASLRWRSSVWAPRPTEFKTRPGPHGCSGLRQCQQRQRL